MKYRFKKEIFFSVFFAFVFLHFSNHLFAKEENSQMPDVSLTEELNKKREASKKQVPAEYKAIMQKANQDLAKLGLIQKAKKKGDDFIDFTLKNFKSNSITLSQMLKKGPVIIAFYRGGWCPYCNIQLRSYQKHLSEFQKKGATLIAISPEIGSEAEKTAIKDKLEFEVLSDLDNQVARKYGLVFQLPQELREVYLKFGIDLVKNQKSQKWELPIPATYVIAPSGKIVFSFLNIDYAYRADPKDILKALDQVNKK